MPATYEPIATQTLTVAAADIFFNSIPQTYTDLVLVMSGGCAANSGIGFRVNGSNSSIYSVTFLEGITSATSFKYTSQNWLRIGYNASWSVGLGQNAILNFQNYSNTTTNKTILSRVNSIEMNCAGASIGMVGSTSAITSINLMTSNGNTYNVGSTFTLYGIKAA